MVESTFVLVLVVVAVVRFRQIVLSCVRAIATACSKSYSAQAQRAGRGEGRNERASSSSSSSSYTRLVLIAHERVGPRGGGAASMMQLSDRQLRNAVVCTCRERRARGSSEGRRQIEWSLVEIECRLLPQNAAVRCD